MGLENEKNEMRRNVENINETKLSGGIFHSRNAYENENDVNKRRRKKKFEKNFALQQQKLNDILYPFYT